MSQGEGPLKKGLMVRLAQHQVLQGFEAQVPPRLGLASSVLATMVSQKPGKGELGEGVRGFGL